LNTTSRRTAFLHTPTLTLLVKKKYIYIYNYHVQTSPPLRNGPLLGPKNPTCHTIASFGGPVRVVAIEVVSDIQALWPEFLQSSLFLRVLYSPFHFNLLHTRHEHRLKRKYKNMAHRYMQGCTNPGRLNSVRWRLILVDPRYGISFMSPCWQLHFKIAAASKPHLRHPPHCVLSRHL
jgi:hypothetical protein